MLRLARWLCFVCGWAPRLLLPYCPLKLGREFSATDAKLSWGQCTLIPLSNNYCCTKMLRLDGWLCFVCGWALRLPVAILPSQAWQRVFSNRCQASMRPIHTDLSLNTIATSHQNVAFGRLAVFCLWLSPEAACCHIAISSLAESFQQPMPSFHEANTHWSLSKHYCYVAPKCCVWTVGCVLSVVEPRGFLLPYCYLKLGREPQQPIPSFLEANTPSSVRLEECCIWTNANICLVLEFDIPISSQPF